VELTDRSLTLQFCPVAQITGVDICSVLHGYGYIHGFHIGTATGMGTGTRILTRQIPIPVAVPVTKKLWCKKGNRQDGYGGWEDKMRAERIATINCQLCTGHRQSPSTASRHPSPFRGTNAAICHPLHIGILAGTSTMLIQLFIEFSFIHYPKVYILTK
jgi:hypothetical protein